MNDLVADLMRREDMTSHEVVNLIKERFDGVEPLEWESIIVNEFGFDPDYIFDLVTVMTGKYQPCD